MHETSSGWTQLWQEWGFKQEPDDQNKCPLSRLSPIVQILRHPASLMEVFYSSVFRRLFGSSISKDAVVNGFFDDANNHIFAMHLELQIENSERYTKYLRSRGLLIADEQSQQIQ